MQIKGCCGRLPFRPTLRCLDTAGSLPNNSEITKTCTLGMATALIIPLILAAIAGLAGYLLYRYVVYDAMCKNTVNRILRSYDIRKTPAQIIREFHEITRGESISEREVRTPREDVPADQPGPVLGDVRCHPGARSRQVGAYWPDPVLSQTSKPRVDNWMQPPNTGKPSQLIHGWRRADHPL